VEAQRDSSQRYKVEGESIFSRVIFSGKSDAHTGVRTDQKILYMANK
jgi:hypothetical protein